MKKKSIHLICAARPNFMKIAPLYHALKKENIFEPKIIHTGQHYDYQMSQSFFNDLGLGSPDEFLEIGSGSHAEQTGKVMISYEKICERDKPDLVVVVGDVNSTMAAAITAKKNHRKVAHLEAGLRSFDREMPEEINRILTDSISDILWTPSIDGNENLENEGVAKEKIKLVGNIMIDSFCMLESKINQQNVLNELVLKKGNFVVLTLHRPSNVDSVETLEKIIRKVEKIEGTILFPLHPRTRKVLDSISLIGKNIKVIDPQSYLRFMSLVKNCSFVVTDSGGIQEETTYLGIPCFTLRDNTERPITIIKGTNQLVNADNLLDKIKDKKKGEIPPLWDGKTAERIVLHLKEVLF
ncbi:MAG: UDP-N-acetylglucosamine 2-epimerase (non-hydrolyzing) [Oligoflexia bacterium]|nr:UDP-N-acetylglucosamine 2-epimerase (non-hydrolyzing) [Oligoflexia bacterium]